jgi:hypothetical protein
MKGCISFLFEKEFLKNICDNKVRTMVKKGGGLVIS